MFEYKYKNRYAYATILSLLVKAEFDSEHGEVNMKEYKINSGLRFSSLPMKIESLKEVGYIGLNMREKIRYFYITDLGQKYLDDNRLFIIVADCLNDIIDPPVSY